MNELDLIVRDNPELQGVPYEVLARELKQELAPEMSDQEYYAAIGFNPTQQGNANIQIGSQENSQQMGQKMMPGAQGGNTPDGGQGFFETVNPYLRKANKFAEDTLHLPEYGAGILQTLADIPISVANLGLKGVNAALDTDVRIPHPDFRALLNKPKTLGGDIAHLAGNITGGVPGFGAAYSVADKLPRASGYAGLAGDIAKGIGTGYATGEHGDNDEGRIASAVLGAPAAVVNSLLKSTTGQNIGRAYKEVKTEYNKLYNGVLSSAEAEGLSKHLNLPKKFDAKSFKGVSDKYVEPLKKAIDSRSIKDAHKAQSKLGSFVRYQDKLRSAGNPINDTAYDAAVKQQKALQKAINNSLAKSSKGLDSKYKEITKGYLKDVVPYKENSAVLKHANNKLTNTDLAKKINKGVAGEQFRKNLSSLHPEIGITESAKATADALQLKDILKIATGTALGGGAIGYGAHKFGWLGGSE